MGAHPSIIEGGKENGIAEMTLNLSNGLVGLSLMTGGHAFATVGAGIAFESRAVRTAKAQFTAEPTTPPWKQPADRLPFSAQLSAIKAMRTIIDKSGTGVDLLPPDIQTSFTTYKALDRLRTLAEAAASTTASDAQRKSMQIAFAKGMTDLETFLSKAPSDQVNIAFGQPSRYTKSVGIAAPDKYAMKGPMLVEQRADAIPGLTGQEKFTIALSKPGGSDSITVDLATGPQPPTLDAIADAFNQAIAAVPMRNPDGSLYLDANGETQPRWLVRFVPEKGEDGWGFNIKTPMGVEQVAITEASAKDSLIVAAGQTALDAPTSAQVFRIDDPAGAASRTTIAGISSLDRVATERAELLAKNAPPSKLVLPVKKGDEPPPPPNYDVNADTDAAAIATDAYGNSYIVGTTAGDFGAIRSDGDDNLFLTKVDSQGRVLWQRGLGAGGSSEGAAVTVGADGSVTVAGTVNGNFDGASTDGDMLVARFTADGDEEFATVVRNAGADVAQALAVGSDGSVYVGGRASGNGGDAYLARLDASGRITERRKIDLGGSERITSLAVDGDGNLLALMNANGVASVRKMDGGSLATDLASIDLGTADARALAMAADGSIAVGGMTSAALAGTQVNGTGGGRDGFVATLDAGLASARVTYLATAEEDQVDSLTFLDGTLYAGGRTTGALGGDPRRGAVDGFVARIDAATGTVAGVTQFGQPQLRTEPVQVAVAKSADSAVSALGFAAGPINPPVSDKLVAQTALRAGDQFAVRVNDGTVRKITIGEDDTLKSLADRLRTITGSKVKLTTPLVDGERTLRIDPKAGNSIELIAGPEGSDALSKLGLDAQRIVVPPPVDDDAPKVRPGGSFGLGLTHAFNLSTLDDAKLSLKKLKEAVSMSQTAYRSLYWDDTKAMMVDGTAGALRKGGSTARQQSQLANYQAALNRLATPNTSFGF